jgi:hypothetical protein
VERGTKIVIELNDNGKEFADAGTVQDILEKHSNFVSFPILLNGNRVNTVAALWTQSVMALSLKAPVPPSFCFASCGILFAFVVIVFCSLAILCLLCKFVV